MFCLYNIDKASNGESVCHWNLHLPKTSKKKKVSVSLAPVGFTHAKWSAAFRFSINYILWFHTWQCIQYREIQQGSVDKNIVTDCSSMEPLLYHTNEREATWRGNAIRNCRHFVRKRDLHGGTPSTASPRQLTVQHAVKMLSPLEFNPTPFVFKHFKIFPTYFQCLTLGHCKWIYTHTGNEASSSAQNKWSFEVCHSEGALMNTSACRPQRCVLYMHLTVAQ